MISIITAVYNQIDMNKLFYECLKKYTYYPFELIVIDNNSNDGSADYFEKCGATVIKNDDNYSYPYCQNQGIRKAKYEYLAFLNNDIIVAKNWDKNIISIMEINKLEVATVSGIERSESKSSRKKYMLRWKIIKNMISIFSIKYPYLKLMHKIMYGDWEKFSEKRLKAFENKTSEGFCGNSVIIKKTAFSKIGYWDERIQAADFDLYMRTKVRNIEKGDIRPCHVVLGVFNHHYIRLTAKQKYPPYKDIGNIITFEEKWGKEFADKYLKCIEEK